jgi:predicted lipoprotein
MKKYVVLLALSLTLCVPPAPADESWPYERKSDFVTDCYKSLVKDHGLLQNFSHDMLKSICLCTADEMERSYDWNTFAEMTQPPLTKEAEKKFFTTSYECALAEKTKEFI